MEANNPVWRYRINLDYSTKGVLTTSSTVEVTGGADIDLEDTLKLRATEFHNWVNATWPPPDQG